MKGNTDRSLNNSKQRYFTHSAVYLAVLILTLLSGCLNTDPEEGWKPACPYDEPKEAINEGDPMITILSPNGGETFHIGDTLTLLVTAEGPTFSAYVDFIIRGESVYLPNFNRMGANISGDGKIDTITYTIPDTLGRVSIEGTVKESSVSDSCLIKLTHYNDPRYYDYTNCYFRIKE